jgi:Ca2+-binding RTX toxin-like protein
MGSTRGTIRRIALGALGAAAALVALPAAASAAVTCSFDGGTGALSVTVTDGTTQVAIGRAVNPSTDVLVDDTFDLSSPIACAGGTPTLATTALIAVDETSSTQGTLLRLNFLNGRLEPGLGADTGTAEIEVTYAADTSGDDELRVDGDTEGADQSFRFGAVAGPAIAGDLNADGDGDDVTGGAVDSLSAIPGTGDDTFSADGTGSASFTGPVPTDMTGFDSQGNDSFVAGNGFDNRFTGGPGNDTVTGGPNADSFHMEEGDDTFDGGGGSNDFASYESTASATGVTLDLSQSGPQNTGDLGIDQVTNVESTVGSNGSDHLTGTDGANTLFGGNLTQDTGNDVLNGLGGTDMLNARKGDDVLIGGAGNDTLNGEPGIDTASFALGSTGPVTFSLDQALTGISQVTGGAGNDTLIDSSDPTDPDAFHDVENLIGSPFGGDVLTGSGLANFIDVRDGLADTVTCLDPPPPPPADSVRADQPGVDSINADCEEVDFAPAPPPSSEQDQLAPDTSVSGKRKVRTRKNRARVTFALASTEPGSSFECSIDSRPFVPCVSPFSTKLRIGKHLLAVRSRDAAGNVDALPATFPVKVRRLLPAP